MARLNRFSIVVCGALVLSAVGCAGFSPFAKHAEQTQTQSVTKVDTLPVDPWSLGLDVFARNSAQSATVTEQPVPSSPVDSVPPRADSAPAVQLALPEPAPQIEATPDVVQSALSERTESYEVQVGSFLDLGKAKDTAARAATALGMPGLLTFEYPFYRVRFGEDLSRNQADSLMTAAMSRGFYDSRIIRVSTQ